MKIALITGITGMDAANLAKYLLDLDYYVIGTERRSSTPRRWRLEELGILNRPSFTIVSADLTDQGSLDRVVSEFKPDEVYNLAAQSFVGASWDSPIQTSEVTGLGVTRVLEAVRNNYPEAKVYQAGSSEMFGGANRIEVLNEKSSFKPRSPYGVAKVYGHNMAINYRESYGMFVSNGILFNHETFISSTPVIVSDDDGKTLDIKPLVDVVDFDHAKKEYQSKPIKNLMVWDIEGWTKVKHASAYPHDVENDNKNIKMINSRNGCFIVTGDHIVFDENLKEIEVKNIEVGDKTSQVELPSATCEDAALTEKEAYLMGLIVADGYISDSNGVRITTKSKSFAEKIKSIWKEVGNCDARIEISKSGFTGAKNICQVHLKGKRIFNKKDFYNIKDLVNSKRTKKIPKSILNSPKHIMLSFLKGYNCGDGLKSNKCTYEFKNFKTNSQTLAMGLLYLVSQTTKQDYNITVEYDDRETFYYSINLLSDAPNSEEKRELVLSYGDEISQREVSRQTGVSRTFIRKIRSGLYEPAIHHLKKTNNEVKKIINLPSIDCWLYDLETESSALHAGVGNIRLHNSPLRGIEFVTRKVTDGVARISHGLQENIQLLNLDSKRDWGHSIDYARGMHLMLQHHEPDDFVLATNKVYGVDDLCRMAFKHIEIDNWRDHIVLADKGRPADVKYLQGDYSKAKDLLGWEPIISFESMIEEMVEADLRRVRAEKGKT